MTGSESVVGSAQRSAAGARVAKRMGPALKISVTNIGPIRKADIEIAPLTVFIGPNNTGKSILATVAYSALGQNIGKFLYEIAREVQGTFPQAFDGFFSGIPEKKPIPLSELPEEISEYIKRTSERALINYLEDVESKLATSISASIYDLRRKADGKSPRASIAITSGITPWRGVINVYAKSCRETIESLNLAAIAFPDDKVSSQVRRLARLGKQESRFATGLFAALGRELAQDTYYLPAARSGILQSHKSLTEAALHRAASLGAKGASEKPLMTGIVSDFLGELNQIDPNATGEFSDEAARLEQEILHGSIAIRSEPGVDVLYRVSDVDYPVSRMSSMVSELAPIVLYLRHRLKPDDTLIVEEPEAHLHPAAQVALAGCLVRLVRRGLRIILTTHSEYFLQQINSAIMAALLPKERVADLKVAGDQLAAKLVSAYFFEAKDSGTNVIRLPINPRAGIPNLGFDAVTEYQYNELATLDRRIGDEEEST
jgi:predicted ATPase